MGTKYLGQPFDIHGGGFEHTNIHHECEIAQAEGAEGKKFVNYWLHCGMLNLEGQKMSKSIGNFVTLKDILKEHDPRAVRLIMVQCHYRSDLNYTKKSIEDAEKTLKRLDNFILSIKELIENPITKDSNESLNIKNSSSDIVKKLSQLPPLKNKNLVWRWFNLAATILILFIISGFVISNLYSKNHENFQTSKLAFKKYKSFEQAIESIKKDQLSSIKPGNESSVKEKAQVESKSKIYSSENFVIHFENNSKKFEDLTP